MYERLLDRTLSPTFDDLIAYSSESGKLWLELDQKLRNVFSVKQQIRFPYGNSYGWSCKYSVKGKHLCDIFAENGSFTVHFRISDQQQNSVYNDLLPYAKAICDNKYPCKGGGWLSFRVLSHSNIEDVFKLLSAKVG